MARGRLPATSTTQHGQPAVHLWTPMLMLVASWLKTLFFLLYLFTVVDILELFGRVFLNSPDFETLESRGSEYTCIVGDAVCRSTCPLTQQILTIAHSLSSLLQCSWILGLEKPLHTHAKHRHTLTHILFGSNVSVEGVHQTKSSNISPPGPRQIPDVGIDLSSIDRRVRANHISAVHYLSIVSHLLSHSLPLPDSGATCPHWIRGR